MSSIRLALLGAALLSASACSTSPAGASAAPSSSVKAAIGHVDFADSQFSGSICPKAHPLATCFSGTATAALPPLGHISISRSVISGDQNRSAPKDCEPADTTGTLKDTRGGIARISGSGTLCGLLAKYRLLVDHGTGSLAKLRMTGTITNNGGAETWDVATLSTGGG